MTIDLQTRKRLASERAEQIRLGLQSTGVLYAKAIEQADWEVLGYTSVRAWAKGEFGPDRFSPQRRKEIHEVLTNAGLTQRQIAAATGASVGTVARDQQAATSNGTNSSAPNGAQVSPRQQAARDREAAARLAREETPAQESEPAAIIPALPNVTVPPSQPQAAPPAPPQAEESTAVQDTRSLQRITQMCASLADITISDYLPEDADLGETVITGICDALITLRQWQERQLAAVQEYLRRPVRTP